jgi:hypothetical protein
MNFVELQNKLSDMFDHEPDPDAAEQNPGLMGSMKSEAQVRPLLEAAHAVREEWVKHTRVPHPVGFTAVLYGESDVVENWNNYLPDPNPLDEHVLFGYYQGLLRAAAIVAGQAGDTLHQICLLGEEVGLEA